MQQIAHQVGLRVDGGYASKGYVRPSACAVPGMNCAMPWAPAGELAKGLKFDSA